MLRLAHIRTASEAEAQKAMRDLEQGWNFAEVARRYSIAPTAAHGGAIDAWYGRGNLEEMGLPLEVGEQIFDLQVEDLSQPLLVGEHYEIFKVLSQGPAPTHYRAAFLREQYWNEFRTRWNDLIAQLKDRLNAQLDGEAIQLLVERMAESDGRGMLLGPEEQEVILCRFKGGQVTLLDFAETYNAYWFIRSVSFDSSGIAEFIHRDLLPRTLVYQAALQEGLDQDSTIAAWLQDKKKSLLLEALRREEVVERTEVDSAMARQYYADHPQHVHGTRRDSGGGGASGDPRRSRTALAANPRWRTPRNAGRPPHAARGCRERARAIPHPQPPLRTASFRCLLRFGGRRAGGSAYRSRWPSTKAIRYSRCRSAFPRVPRPLPKRPRGRDGGYKSDKKRPSSTPYSSGSGINTPIGLWCLKSSWAN